MAEEEQKSIDSGAETPLSDPAPAIEQPKETELTQQELIPLMKTESAEETPKDGSTQVKVPAEAEKMRPSTIIGIIAVFIVILAVIFFATRQPAAVTLGNDGQTVSVSGAKEQGKVNIIEETKSDINVTVNDGTKTAYPKVKVIVYLGNTQKNPNSADCSLAYPVEREIDKKYDSNMINTMLGLLEPLSAAEKEQGFVSTVPSGTILKYLKLDDSGAMSVNLSGTISQAAGSCAVTAIKAQIKDTIMQFAAVKSVVICIDGNCDESRILQP